jgi:hypothetical protein
MAIVRREGVYLSTKVYENINCIFRIWNAEDPKDRVLKSYNLKVKIMFECHYLDQGHVLLDDNHDCLKEFSKMLNNFFKNKTVVALDDPEMSIFQALDHKGVIVLSTLPFVSTEKIAEEIFSWFKVWLTNSRLIDRVDVRSVDLTVNNMHTVTYVE